MTVIGAPSDVPLQPDQMRERTIVPVAPPTAVALVVPTGVWPCGNVKLPATVLAESV